HHTEMQKNGGPSEGLRYSVRRRGAAVRRPKRRTRTLPTGGVHVRGLGHLCTRPAAQAGRVESSRSLSVYDFRFFVSLCDAVTSAGLAFRYSDNSHVHGRTAAKT